MIDSPEKEQEYAERIYEYVENTECPYQEEIAIEFGINVMTLVEWKAKYTLIKNALDVLMTKQLLALKRNSVEKSYNTAASIFLMHNNHGLNNTAKVDVTSNGETISFGFDKLLSNALKAEPGTIPTGGN